MRRLLVVAALLSGMAVAAPGQAATTRDGAILGTTGPYYGSGPCNDYTAGPMTISAGDAAKWTNCDSITHTVTFSGFGSPNIAPGKTWERTFVAPGAYEFHCNIHDAMTSQLVVMGNVPSSAPAQTSTTALQAASTTAAVATTVTQTQPTLDLDGVFDQASTTTASSSTTTSDPDELAGVEADDDEANGNGNGLMIILLVLAIGGLGASGRFAVRRMRGTGPLT